jgi:hypothetical protein
MDVILGKPRRMWSDDEKRAFVAETFEPGSSVSTLPNVTTFSQALSFIGASVFATAWLFQRRRRALVLPKLPLQRQPRCGQHHPHQFAMTGGLQSSLVAALG